MKQIWTISNKFALPKVFTNVLNFTRINLIIWNKYVLNEKLKRNERNKKECTKRDWWERDDWKEIPYVMTKRKRIGEGNDDWKYYHNGIQYIPYLHFNIEKNISNN